MFLLLFISGCGYSLLSKKPLVGQNYKRISIPIFKNKTLEPGIEEFITRAVSSEFMLDPRLRVVLSEQADCFLRGKVLLYSTSQAVSFDKFNNIAEYRLFLTIAVEVRDSKNNMVILNLKKLHASADYAVPPQLTEIKNAEQRALRVAARKLAKDIIRLMERF